MNRKAINISFFYTICGASIFTVEIDQHERNQENLAHMFRLFIDFFEDFRNEENLEDLLIDMDFQFDRFILDPNLLWHGFDECERILRHGFDDQTVMVITIESEEGEGERHTIFTNEEGSIDRFVDFLKR